MASNSLCGHKTEGASLFKQEGIQRRLLNIFFNVHGWIFPEARRRDVCRNVNFLFELRITEYK